MKIDIMNVGGFGFGIVGFDGIIKIDFFKWEIWLLTEREYHAIKESITGESRRIAETAPDIIKEMRI